MTFIPFWNVANRYENNDVGNNKIYEGIVVYNKDPLKIELKLLVEDFMNQVIIMIYLGYIKNRQLF